MLVFRKYAGEGYFGVVGLTRLIHLALMAPDIVQRIARGEHPPELNAAKLMRLTPLPHDWGEQRKMLGFD